jgi:hypothetical protein
MGRPSPPVLVDHVLHYAERVVASATGKPHKIKVLLTETKVHEYRGIWLRGHTESTIHISQDLNRCWRRFVICKEAIHLIVDDEPSRFARSIEEQANEAFEMYWPRQSRVPLSSEQLAAIVAFEVLYPWEHRCRTTAPPKDMNVEARKFLIPERYLDTYFRFPYGFLSESINDALP